MPNFREITIKAEEAKRLFLKDRKAGEQEFATLLKLHPTDGMIHFKFAEANEAVQEYTSASNHFNLAETYLPKTEFKEKARKGLERVTPYLQDQTRTDNQNIFEKVKSNIPSEILKAVEDAVKDLSEKEYNKVVYDIGQEGFRRLLEHLEKTNGIHPEKSANFEERRKNLQKNVIIDKIADDQLRMVQHHRNNIEYHRLSLNQDEAKICIEVFKTALVRIFQKKIPLE